MKKRLVLLVTVALVAGAALVAVAGPAGAGPGPPTAGLVECDAEPFGSYATPAGPDVATVEAFVYCAELTVEKDVDGDDPEVEFPIEVTCETVSQSGVYPTEVLDPGDLGDGPETETVELGDGESETFQIPVLTVFQNSSIVGSPYRLVDCEVSEPGDADLPSGWECELTDIAPDDDVTLGTILHSEADQSATVIVTNECEEPPATTTSTTTTTKPPVPAAAAPTAAAAVVAQPRVTG